jgi:hypothetical protein
MYHVLHVSESVRGECLTHVTDQFALASFVTFASEIRLLRAIYDVNSIPTKSLSPRVLHVRVLNLSATCSALDKVKWCNYIFQLS